MALDDAEIEALHVSVDPRVLAAPSEEIDFQILREKYEGTARNRAEATHAAFDGWIADHPGAPIAPEWKEVSGSERNAICREASSFDALVVPRGHNADGIEALHTLLYHAQRPFFLAPRNASSGAGPAIIECIVIAWNATPACGRATQGAVPWLKKSRHAAILLVNEGQEVAGEITAELAAAGVRYDIVSVARDKEKLGDEIVVEAKNLGASMLVLGAHRHNMLIEWLLGHTTDEILAHDDLPLFLAH